MNAQKQVLLFKRLVMHEVLVTEELQDIPFAEAPSESPATSSPEAPRDNASTDLPVLTFIPTLPRDLCRYNVADSYVRTAKHMMFPLLFSHPDKLCAPDDREAWDRYVHPEGMPYFHHKNKQIVTFCDAVDDGVNECMIAAIGEMEKRMHRHYDLAPKSSGHHSPSADPSPGSPPNEWHHGIPEWELCIKVDPKRSECRYYVVDWDKRVIFWLEGHDPNPLNTGKLGLNAPVSYEHTRTMLECHFWKHVEFFPAHRRLPEGSFEELKGWLTWAITDRMMGFNRSTIVRDVKEMETSLGLLTCQKWEDPSSQSYLTAVVARHWFEIWDDRAYNMFGLQTARLTREQSRYFEPYCHTRPSSLAKALSFLMLFNQPRVWYVKLCEAWVDKTVFLDIWRDMLQDTKLEWGSMGFQATILLAANMGFLTINPLGDSEAAWAQVARTTSVISTMLSIGSSMSAMLLLHDHQDMMQPGFDLENVQKYFKGGEKRPFGLFGAAMLYSFPFSMFLWSLILFIAAVLAFSLAKWQPLTGLLTTGFTMLVFSLVIAQALYFRREPRVYKGSSWRAPCRQDQAQSEKGHRRSLFSMPLGTEQRRTTLSSLFCRFFRERSLVILPRFARTASLSPQTDVAPTCDVTSSVRPSTFTSPSISDTSPEPLPCAGITHSDSVNLDVFQQSPAYCAASGHYKPCLV